MPLQLLQDKSSPGETIDLNETLQTVLKKYTADQQNKFILRYDKLPLVKGNYDQYICLFDSFIFDDRKSAAG